MITRDELERLLIEHGWQKRENIYSVSYHKDNIRVDIGNFILIEYYSGECSIDQWLEKASISHDVDYEDVEWHEESPHQIMFWGGTLKL